MIAIVRSVAFLTSAIGTEFFRGVGVAAFAIALLFGWRRVSIVFLPIVAALGAMSSLALPDDVGGVGKVAHGLSNVPFVALLYVIIVVAGYAIGRAAHAARRVA